MSEPQRSEDLFRVHLSRRSLVQRTLLLVGGAVTLPTLAACAPTPAAQPTAAPPAPKPTTAPAPAGSPVAATSPVASGSPAAVASDCLADLLKPVADKYNPPVELTTVRSALGILKYEPGDDANNNPWTRAYAQKYGIVQKMLWEVPVAQYPQRVNLMISSGELPDYFLVQPVQFSQLAQAGQLMDLTDVYARYASERVKQTLNEGGPLPLQAATIKGRLMAIPHTGVPRESVPVLWVRADWRKKLGLPEPKTMADLLKIAEAFSTQDPDGNGQRDTFGLAVDKDINSTTTLNGFFNGFHAYRATWIKDDKGQLAYGSIQPAMKGALGQLQDLYKARLIDPEFGSKSFQKVVEDLQSARIGMIIASPYLGLQLQATKDNNPAADWETYPIVSVDGQPARIQVPQPGVLGYWVVKQGVKQPEAILKMLDLFINVFYQEGSACVPARRQLLGTETNGGLWSMNAMSAFEAFGNVRIQEAVTKALETNDPSQVPPRARETYDNILKYRNGENKWWYVEKIWGPAGSMKVVSYYRKNNLYQDNQFIVAPGPAMVRRLPTLDRLEEETFTRIITGAAPIGEFDNFVTQWKQQGGDEVTREVNEWAASR